MFFDSSQPKKRWPVHKAKGVTPSERYLNSLCEHTFLSLWSYPNIYRDSKIGGKGHGKELCDMLVVFGNHVLIFSDKHCVFPQGGNLELDWKRWYKRAIEKSARQAWGAERYLKNNPDRIYLDRTCTNPFPFNLPPPESAKYHLIVVAHGAETACKAHFGGGSGSLILHSKFDGYEDIVSDFELFTITDLNVSKTFIHVFTKHTLDILLQTLDTVYDFASYLDKKESFFRCGVPINVTGEEHLLAYYLQKKNDKGEHDFLIDPNYSIVVFPEGLWEDFCLNPKRQEQIKQNKVSYLWDELIEGFSEHAFNATTYFSNGDLSDTEISLRFMASEPRTVRRLLSKYFLDIFKNHPNKNMKWIRVIKPTHPNSPYYVFLMLPVPDELSYEDYRKVRLVLLASCVKVTKLLYSDALDIVGIASEPLDLNSVSSKDFLYLDARDWSEAMNVEAQELQEEFDILLSSTMHYGHVKEYPSPDDVFLTNYQNIRKVGRNEPCPCGSGQKYKHCHGKKQNPS